MILPTSFKKWTGRTEEQLVARYLSGLW
jgi:hypothetical protein